ncbi:MAG: ABC-type lipoprotein release transport system permease subunit [Sulfurimonas sp.]|jgi:ABC-type lipoprotein release transport system permease subunit
MFSMIIKMAWKNSFLRLSRTLMLITMIAISMSMMIGLQGLYDGMANNMLDKNKRSASGDISFFAKEYRLQKDIKYRIKDASVIKEELQKIPNVKAVVIRVQADGLIATARKSSFASLQGINLSDEDSFGRFSEFLKSGEMKLDKRGAIIGLELAKTLKVKIGSKIVFSTQDSAGDINSISFRVRGLVQTTNIRLDSNAVYVDIKRVHKFLGLNSSEATQIAIMSYDKSLVQSLKNKYNFLEVKSFLELQPMMKMMQDMMNVFNSMTFFIVMGVVFIGIFGVMYVSILDRVREFGIMLGIGMQYKYIRLQIIFEAIFVGLFGYVSGAILGLILLMYLQYYGIDLSSFSDALEMWGYEAIIYGTIKVSYFTTTFVAILFASVLSVIIPLSKIKKLNPIEVIKAEK